MGKDFLDIAMSAQALLWIFVEDLEDEILCFWGGLDLFWELNFAFFDELKHLGLGFAVVKRRKAVHHFVGQNAQRPPIGCLVVSLAFKHLRSEILCSSTKSPCDFSISYDLGHSEVSEADIAVIIHKHIF